MMGRMRVGSEGQRREPPEEGASPCPEVTLAAQTRALLRCAACRSACCLLPAACHTDLAATVQLV